MVRIKINWEMISPFLQAINGILIIEDIDIYSHSTELLSCEVIKKNGQTGYRSIEEHGYSREIFKKYENRIDTMVDSYFNGVKLSRSIYSSKQIISRSCRVWLKASDCRSGSLRGYGGSNPSSWTNNLY